MNWLGKMAVVLAGYGAALLVAAAAVPGCTGEALKRTGYETLHNVSDMKNDQDPKYDPGPRPSYDVYRQQREETLRPAPPPAVPAAPAVPEPSGAPADK